MRVGSPAYVLMLLLLVALTAGVYVLLRHRSAKTQTVVLRSMVLVNMAQHFLKSLLYPQHTKEGFTIVSTAYNVCAALIILMPLAYTFHSRFLKNVFFFVGTVAGAGAIAYPVWFLEMPTTALGWEYVRFYLCHALLFLSAILPLLCRWHRPAYHEFWQIGVGFLGLLCLILCNNTLFTLLGFNPGYGPHNLYQGLLRHNACGLMGPSSTTPAWLGTLATGRCIPILWYAVPVYGGITGGGWLLFSVLRRYGLTLPNRHKELALQN